ncbi:MAG: hypothetical protein WCP15_03045 [bacterium]
MSKLQIFGARLFLCTNITLSGMLYECSEYFIILFYLLSGLAGSIIFSLGHHMQGGWSLAKVAFMVAFSFLGHLSLLAISFCKADKRGG